MKRILVGLILLAGNALAQNIVRPQRFTVTSIGGQVDLWDTGSSRWLPCIDGSQCGTGSLFATRESSSVQLTFEPAVMITAKENSRVKLNNFLVNENKKMIRMQIALEKGDFDVKTSGLQNITLFLTLNTPVAVLQIHSAEASIHVSSDSTVVNVKNGELKAENRSSQIKAVVREKFSAVVTGKTPEVVVESLLGVELLQNADSKEPTIAILSIQSSGVSKGNASNVANYVAEKYQEASSNSRVLYLDDIREMLRVENSEGMLDCFTDSCISRIGGVLGADLVIIGNLGQVGKNFLFSLKLIDVTRDKTLSRITKTVESDVGLILNEIPGMVNKLANAQELIKPAKPAASETAGGKTAASPFSEKEVWVNGGTFYMGLDFDGKSFDALPVHTVSVSGFYLDKYEVTRAEFEKVMGVNPSSSRGCEKCPVENVTWDEADQYCRKLGKRLPSEAEWEYACRAGTTSKFHYGDVLSGEMANFDSKSSFGGVPATTPRKRSIPVGEFKPNAWGLHDMHGNVAEWCYDWYDAAYYGNSPDKNPKGPGDGKLKVVRGGSWNGAATTLFSGKRFAYNPQMRLSSIGFRCAKDDYGNK